MMNSDFSSSIAGVMGAMGAFLVFFVLILIAFVVLLIIANWKLFKKAGKKGWYSIVPFYSTWVLVTEIAELNWWWFLLSILSVSIRVDSDFTYIVNIFNIFVYFNVYYNVCKKFKKETIFAIGCSILGGIFIPILAFSKDCVYDKSIPVSKDGIFGKVENSNVQNNEQPFDQNTNNLSNQEYIYCPQCGEKHIKGTKFCSKCGKEL